MNNANTSSGEKHVTIVGVGLIGGSVAAALRHRFPSTTVTGIGRKEDRLKQAIQQGLLHSSHTSISQQSIAPGSLVVICLPVDQIADAIRQIAVLNDSSIAVTDVGSVKSLIYETLNGSGGSVVQYVGAHPIAGGEKTGFEHAQANLFAGRKCIITPEVACHDVLARVERFWQSIGCDVSQMSATEHDQILSLTSHLPHVLAAVSASAVGQSLLPYTGSGFRDTTRIAEGSADLWTTILLGNRENTIRAIRLARELLDQFSEAIATNNCDSLHRCLARAADIRRRLGDKNDKDCMGTGSSVL